MAKVLVTGANGMLGSDLCEIFKEKGHQVIGTDLENLDVCDEEQNGKSTCYGRKWNAWQRPLRNI